MIWHSNLRADPTAWLLEPDNPSARYLALAQLLDRAADGPEALSAQSAITTARPARAILEAQYVGPEDAAQPAGYWIKPDIGYSPKYRATVWQLIFLAQLGAPRVQPIQRACEYVLQHSRQATDGRFIAARSQYAAIDCLNGNLLWALQRFGFADDAGVVQAREATAQAAARRGFACHHNGDRPCAWGAVKVLRAFLELPPARRSAAVEATIGCGTELLLSVPIVEAAYPAIRAASERWFALAFPLDYSADLLEVATVLALAGCAGHPHLQAVVRWLLDRQDADGRWMLEHTPGKTWGGFGELGRPNKWVTLRALRLLKMLG